MKKLNVNTEIILTHLLSRKRQTIIASLGVTVGMGLFIIMMAIVGGTNAWSDRLLSGSQSSEGRPSRNIQRKQWKITSFSK